MLKCEEAKAVCFHEVCLSELNEKLDFLKLPENMKIMKILFWWVRKQLNEP